MFSDRISQGDKILFGHVPYTVGHVFLIMFNGGPWRAMLSSLARHLSLAVRFDSPTGDRSLPPTGLGSYVLAYILASENGVKIESITGPRGLNQTGQCAGQRLAGAIG
jgi:hypothetical protein